MKVKITVNVSIGRVVKYFILVDLVLLAGWGMIDPIFSVFIIDEIPGASLVTVGTTAGLYWILKSALQIPVARYLDRIQGEKDDFYALIIGLIVVAFTALSFAIVQSISQLYLVQIIRAVGFGLYAASWPAIFSRHLDKNKVSFDWALDSTAAGLSVGMSAFIGGLIATIFGFRAVFIFGAILSALSALVLLMVPDLVLPKSTTDAEKIKDRSRSQIG